MLKRTSRIQNQRLIDKLGRKGHSFKTANFVFKYLPSDLPDSKFAVNINKKVAPKAVDRNRVRRQLNESLRLHMSEIPSPVVCLIIQKKGNTDTLAYNIIESEVLSFINHLLK